jgi:glycosyltransferase involved in cell wall biosynthesis
MNQLSIIVPVYNEEKNLRQVVSEIETNAREILDAYEIIIVNDGSTDNTDSIIEELCARPEKCANIKISGHENNMGSGMAIRTGIKQARYDWVTYIPADGQFDSSEIKKFLEASKGVDIVIGTRLERSDYSMFRRLSSFVFITLVNKLFNTKFKDVNWVHMWKRKIFDNMTIISSGVFFLEEILTRSLISGYKIKEIDSAYRPRLQGKAKGSQPGTIFKTLKEMIVFWIELKFKGVNQV